MTEMLRELCVTVESMKREEMTGMLRELGVTIEFGKGEEKGLVLPLNL